MALHLAHPQFEDLERRVGQWREAGIISQVQGEQIIRFESGQRARVALEENPPVPAHRLTLVAELVSYLGLVLVLASGGIFVSRLWHGLGLWGRVSVGVVVALVGFVGGRTVLRWNEEGTTRLGWLFWLLGTGGVAMTTAVLADRIGGQRASWTLLITGLAVATVSVGLWRNRERPLQFLSSIVGFTLTFAGAVQFTHREPSTLVIGLLVWTMGVALGVLAFRYVRPALLAMLVAQGAVFMGAMAMIASQGRLIGFVCGLSGAVAGVTLGLKKRESPIVTLGIISLFAVVVRALSYYLQGPAAMLVAFVMGVVLVTVVIWRATASRSRIEGGRDLREGRRHALRRHH
ncbi:MAG: DUF2157 domain-containing protein [Acidimicrobiales bacterium]